MIRSSLAFLLAAAAAAQTPIDPVPFPAPLQIPVPQAATSGPPLQLLDFDADADLIRDFAIRWTNGNVTFCYGPEVCASCVDAPVTGARSLARLRGTFAPAAAQGRDGFLVADDAGIGFVALTLTGDVLQRHTVTAPTAWLAAVKLTVTEHLGVPWLLALDPDLRTVRLGQIVGGAITEVGTVLAADDVQQILTYDPWSDGNVRIAVRTRSALQTWLADGTVEAAIPAPTAHWQGGLTAFTDGPVRRLAWVVLTGNTWLLRICQGPAILHQTDISAPGLVPNRFRMVAVDAFPCPGSGTDALLVQQNSTPNQLLMTANASGEFAVHAGFAQPGTAFNVDNCAGCCMDFDRDGAVDWVAMMASTQVLQVIGGISYAVQTPAAAPTPPSPPMVDYLPYPPATTGELRFPTLISPALPNQPAYQMPLWFQTPPSLPTQSPFVYVQAILWHQRVGQPTVAGSTDYDPVTSPVQHNLFPIGSGGTLTAHPVLPFAWNPPSPSSSFWLPNDHYYLMLRVVGLSAAAGSPSATMQWSTQPVMYGIVVDTGPLGYSPSCLNFINPYCDPDPPQRLPVRGGTREVGVLLKPRRLAPPSSTAIVPAPPQNGTIATTQGTWQ